MRFTYEGFIFAILFMVGTESAGTRSHIRDFLKLIPRGRVAFITGKHLLYDQQFRAAFTYLRSSNFETLIRDEITPNQEVQDIVDYLEHDIDLTAIPAIIRKVIIRLRPVQEYGNVKTLASFVQEVTSVLPDAKFSNLIREKNAADPEFAKLYGKIMDPQFKTLVYRARNSESLTEVFATLSQNQIDVNEILDIGFRKLAVWNQPSL